jgi:hypothetical protein
MTDDVNQPKQRQGCLIKTVLAILIIFGVSVLHALTAERSSGRHTPMNPLLGMLACGAIAALWFWKPTVQNSSDESAIKPLDKNENDSDGEER